jgi:hypothetical protein
VLEEQVFDVRLRDRSLDGAYALLVDAKDEKAKSFYDLLPDF